MATKHAEEYTPMLIPVPMEDELQHTSNEPYCNDPACPCHDQAIEEGLFTQTERERYARGEQVL
jgi:hypothetical protein